jgi:hypothetical protein
MLQLVNSYLMRYSRVTGWLTINTGTDGYRDGQALAAKPWRNNYTEATGWPAGSDHKQMIGGR